MARIGIFGGSFDPIHSGHLAVAQTARQQLKLEQVIFVPAAHSPFKPGNPPSADGADRLAMTKLAIAGIEGFSVSDWELRQGGISYTVDTIREFIRSYPQDDLFLIMGADAYEYFDSWKEARLIRSLVCLAVAPRSGVRKCEVGQKELAEAKAVINLEMPLDETSSTNVRIEGNHREISQLGLGKAVQNYIVKHGLYQS